MMLEQQTMEQAELYALGMLDDEQIHRFERQLKADEDLQLYLRQLEDTIATVGLTAPLADPPEDLWDDLKAQVERTPKLLPTLLSRLSVPMWAAAALLILSTVTVHQVFTNQAHEEELALLRGELEEEQAAFEELARRKGVASTSRLILGPLTERQQSFGERGPETPSLISRLKDRRQPLVQNMTLLQEQLAKLQRERDERLTPRPGVSRMVVTSLLDPLLSTEDREARRLELSSEVSEVLKTGLEEELQTSSGSQPAEPIRISGSDSRRGAPVTIEGGGLPSLVAFRFEDGLRAYHRDFPIEEARESPSLMQLTGDRFYDPNNDVLWEPGPEGFYLGTRPDVLPTDETPVTPPEEFPSLEPEVEVEPEQTANPRAYAVIDEITGEGEFIVADIPPLDEGEIYQLWAIDPELDKPVSLGYIPDFEGTTGGFSFSLPDNGTPPTKYSLTIEPAGGSEVPTGPTILD